NDMVKELQARLPKMKKADVDRAIKKHLSLEGLTIALVAAPNTGQGLADKLITGAPTPITYDTAGTPDEILKEDKIIEAFPVHVARDRVRGGPLDQIFDNGPRGPLWLDHPPRRRVKGPKGLLGRPSPHRVRRRPPGGCAMPRARIVAAGTGGHRA